MDKTKGRRHRPPSVLAISSSGGHFVQLLRLMPAFEGCLLTFASTSHELVGEVASQSKRLKLPSADYYTIVEANRNQKLRLILSFLSVLWLLIRLRPDVVISTGAAPGFFALLLGRILGSRTIWVDSIANSDELSLAGQKVGRHADLWLTQWPELVRHGGPQFAGAVL